MLPSRYDLGSNIFSITTRITAIEHSGGGSGGDSDNLYVSRSLKLAYTTPNTSAWIDSNNFVVSRNLYDLILPKANQTTITQNPDNTISIGISQDMGTTSTPQFAGLGINGNIAVSGLVDGVDVSVLQSNFTSHIFNSTTAHFGQDLTITGEPTFKKITLTQNPTLSTDVATKSYVDNNSGSLKPAKSFYDPTSGLPVLPTVGDKYISSGTANGWTANRIYEWNGSIWTERIPTDGYQIFVEGGTLYARKYVVYDTNTWILLDATISHQSISGAGTNTHTAIDNHISNSTTAHFGQDLKSTGLPSFAMVSLSNTPTEQYHTATKGYVDSVVQGIDWQKSVKSFFDPTGGLPSSPVAGDRYISYATAGGWTKDYIYEYIASLVWRETIPNAGFAIYIEGGTIDPLTQMMYNGIVWVKFGSTIDHTSLQNIGINTHSQIDSHISNNTNAHFGQNLSSIGTPTFNTLSITNTTESTSVSTGSLIVAGGFGVSGTTTVNSLKITSITHASDAITGSVTVSGGVGISDNLHVGTTVKIDSTDDVVSSTTGALIVDGGVAINKSLLVGNQITSPTLYLTSTVETTSSSTGALIIDGGIGVSGSLYLNGGLSVTNTTTLNGTTTFNGSPIFNEDIIVASTTESTSASTGSLIIAGGVGIENNLHIAGNLSIGGSISFAIGSFDRITLTGTIDSTSSSTGTLIVNGGAGIQKNLNVGALTTTNSFIVNGTDNATSSTTGVMLVSGGAVFNKNVFVDQLIVNNTSDASATDIGSLHVMGGATIDGNLHVVNHSILNSVFITSTEDATSYTTGSLVIGGGVGIDKSVYIGENLNVIGFGEMSALNLTTGIGSTDTTTGALVVLGGIGVGQNVNIGENVHIYGTDQSTSSTTGSLIVAGGLGLAGNLYVGGSLDIKGSMAFDAAHIVSTTESTSITSGAFIVDGGVGIAKRLNVGTLITTDTLRILSTEDTTTTTSGSVIISGGVGIASNLIVGKDVTILGTLNASSLSFLSSTDESTSVSTGALILGGGMGLAKNLNVGGISKVWSTTDSTDTLTGSLIISGGLGLNKNFYMTGASIKMHNLWGINDKQILQLGSAITINQGITAIIYSLIVTKPIKIKITIIGTDQAQGIYNFICDTIYKFSIEGTTVTSMTGESGTESLNWSHYLTGWRFAPNAFSFTDNGSGSVSINFTHTGIRSDTLQINTIKISSIISHD